MPGPARRRGGDNAGGGGRRWGQGGSGALGPAKAGPAVVEIGSVPRRDRSSSASRSVRRRRARGPGPRGGHFGASPTTPPSDSRRNARLDGGEAVRRRVPPRAPDRSPRTGPTGTAGSYPTPHGRTQIHGVVPDAARSYPKAPLQYDPAPQRTTTRIHVRPARGNGRRPRRTYDRTSNGTTAQPSHRTRPHPTHHPHTPTTATHPDRKPHSTSVRQPPPTTGPATNHPTAQPRQRTELEPELDRTRRGREGEGRRRLPARAGHRRRRLTRSRGSP